MARVGVAIVETNKGILLTKKSGDDVYRLPGGKAKRGETRFRTAIRELKEQTGLEANYANVIFRHDGYKNDYTVVLIKAEQKPKTRRVKSINFFKEKGKINLSKDHEKIVTRFINHG